MRKGQASVTRYPFGSGTSKTTDFLKSRTVTNEKRPVQKLSGAVFVRRVSTLVPLEKPRQDNGPRNAPPENHLPKAEKRTAKSRNHSYPRGKYALNVPETSRRSLRSGAWLSHGRAV